MSKLSFELSQALRAREEARLLLASLDQTGADASSDEATRDSLRKECEQRLRSAESDVAGAREAVKERHQQVLLDLESLQRERSVLGVRQKVGELDFTQYQNADALLAKRIDALESQSTELGRLAKAESAADVGESGADVAKDVDSVKQPHPPASRTGSVRTQSAPVSGAPGMTGWIQKVMQGRTPHLISGALVAVGAVAIVLLLVSAGGGSLSLPGPSGGVDQPVSSEFDEMPAEKPSDAASSGFDSGDSTTATAPFATEFEVPVVVRGAPTVGSLHIELAYDPGAVEVTGIQTGNLPSESLLEYVETPGRVTFGVVCPDGLSGDWEVASVMFAVQSSSPQAGQSPLTYSNVVAHSAESLLEMSTVVSSGSVMLNDMSVVVPSISFT
ncbi:MAG: hypothetical protein JW846_03865 [Dehalococcoidia bacterium]|nr:hypothetical protein [Dehalococcoidia bacterium]